MKEWFKWLMSTVALLALVACGGPSNSSHQNRKTHQVKALPLHQSLHFTGTVSPIREYSLVSPMEAVVQEMNFHYGQLVKKDAVVLTLSSGELQKQYNSTLTDYLKAKDSYLIAKSKFVGTQELWEAGLIPKNNYLSEKSAIDTSRVSLMQAKNKLVDMLAQIDEGSLNKLSDLKLGDFEKISKLLTSSHQLIRLKAPGNGVLLYPPKNNDDKQSRINTGASVKAGQVIALVGDLKGLKVEIDVPEIDIDKIKPGMKAVVSGVAFGKHRLNGLLVAINAQASNTGGGLPSFTAVVEVPNLSDEERAWIKVGMSAAIELSLETEPQLSIPIAAVSKEQGKSYVTIETAQKKLEKKIITTGPTTAESVVVESGLKEGDVVVYG